jgi:alkylated DNA repair dioxygenase AlkB
MNLLFPTEGGLPEGFEYYPSFINEAEEQQLIRAVEDIELNAMIFQGFAAKRKVESFGYDYNFDKRTITKGKEIPTDFHSLVEKVSTFLQMESGKIAELLVTEYPIGSVINWHRDAPPFDVVIGISLLSDCKFRLRPYDKAKQGRNSIISIPVNRRSLYVIKGAARSEWEHSISPVKEKRYSITLRTLRK